MKPVACLLLVLSLAVSAHEASAAGKRFEVSGTYSETCGCRKSCPCIWNNVPSEGHCDAAMVFQFEKGKYGDTDLAGLKVVGVISTPPGETISGSAGHWNLMTFYLDDKATPAQRAGLEKVMHKLVGEKLAKKESIKSVSIKVADDPKAGTQVVDAGSHVHFDIRVSPGMNGKPATIDNAPGALPFMQGPLTQGESKIFTFADGDTKWEYQARNAFFGKFHGAGTAD
jgi:hypothetical protein